MKYQNFIEWKQKMEESDKFEDYKMFDNASEWEIEHLFRAFHAGKICQKNKMGLMNNNK